MKNILLRLREAETGMTGTTASISHFINEKPETAAHMTTRELAEATFTSPSSIVRFCRSVGFKGYSDFRQQLLVDLTVLRTQSTQKQLPLGPNSSIESIIGRVTERNVSCLRNTMAFLDEEVLSACVELIGKARRILLFGIGASLCVARDTYLKLLRINKSCISNDDWHSQLLQAKNSSEGDLAIIFSYSGQTAEMIECMRVLQANGTPVIAITGVNASPIQDGADYVLNVASVEPVFRSGASSSRLAQLCVIDILYELYISRHYEDCIQQFAKTHINK